MRYNFLKALAFTLSAEGGWSNDPQDPGGCTMKGITFATYEEWCSDLALPPPTVDDLRNIPDSHVQAIYRRLYWDTVNASELPDGVDLSVFDFGVNAGPVRSADILQKVIGFTGADNDSVIGPKTIAVVGRESPFLTVSSLADMQEAYYRTLPTFSVFGKGWLARTERRRSAAMALIAGRAYPPSAV